MATKNEQQRRNFRFIDIAFRNQDIQVEKRQKLDFDLYPKMNNFAGNVGIGGNFHRNDIRIGCTG